jgi:hypothetical protein
MSPADTTGRQSRGTWWQRVLVWAFGIVLGLLIYWLLGFILGDIGRLPGPAWDEFEAARIEPELQEAGGQLADQIADINRQIGNVERRQRLLRDSTASSQTTLSQLIQLQRISMEQESTLPEEQQQALVDSQRLFLDNQRRDQEFNESLATLQERRAESQEQLRLHHQRLDEARKPVYEEFEWLERRHRLRVAAIQIGVLTPLLIFGAYLFARHRNSKYAPMLYALDVALLVKTFQVMHEYFPADYFKYVLIVSSLAVIGGLLARLLAMVAAPSRDARLRQYREAYESFFCPICRYPIRRGPLRFMAWTARSLRRASQPLPAAEDESYTCPACATTLYEKCPNCGAVRHALLPACEHCGVAKEV